jgi:hypothetical protein
MGWQADRDSWAGGAPGQDEGLPELLAGFGNGGAWAAAVPSAALATALQAAAGADGLYPGADVDVLVGVARQWVAIESWAAAGLLGSLRAMMREDTEGRPLLRRRADLPTGWDDSLNYEVAAALAMGPVSAGNLASLAWTLGARLPGIGRLLGDGTLTRAKAKLIAQLFEPLDDGEAVRAEALILGELAGKTYFQVQRLAWRAALAVAPDVAERRRIAAEKERARVTVFREESGAVGLSGRDLPAAQALSGHANVLARARQYEASGAFVGQTASCLEALAYLHILNGVTARDAIAFARTADTQPPDEPEHDDADPQGGHNATTKRPDDSDQGEGGTDQGRNGKADSAADWGGPENYRDGHTPESGSAEGRRDYEKPDCDGDPGSGSEPDHRNGGPGDDEEPDGDGGNPGGGLGPHGSGTGPGDTGRRPALPEVIVPLATLLGHAERPGDNRLLGPLDPAITRELTAAAARSPDSRWQVTVVDSRGYAVGNGVARARRSGRQKPQPPSPALCAFPAWVNITVTETLVQQLLAQPRSGAPPGDWELTPQTINGEDGPWTLTLPGGRELSVRFDVVPTHTCDHRHQVDSYQPGERLRRLVQVRDHECTFPTCSRPAHASDFEHARPYDQGGPTCACNAGARSRRCHRVKQMPGWQVTQPRPGWHEWTTSTGRTYVQEPWRYPALQADQRFRW